MKEMAYIDILALFENSREARAKFPSAMAWFITMENKLGPQHQAPGGYLIRGREGVSTGMFLMSSEMGWNSLPERAGRFSWSETAIRLTNNPTLEAIQINYLDIAIDCHGDTVALLTRLPEQKT